MRLPNRKESINVTEIVNKKQNYRKLTYIQMLVPRAKTHTHKKKLNPWQKWVY